MQILPTEVVSSIVNERTVVNIDICLNDGACIGSLAPITKSVLDSRELIEKLTDWRNRMRTAFLTQAPVTIESTTKFLANLVLNDPTRLLFLVQSSTGPVGTLGFKIAPPWVHGACPSTEKHRGRRLGELTNLLRGSRDGHPHLMIQGEIAAMNWAFRELDIELFWTAVPSNNRLALALHKSAGFRSTELIPLHKVDKDGGVHLVPGELGQSSPDGLYAQRIELERSEFIARKNAQASLLANGTQGQLVVETAACELVVS